MQVLNDHYDAIVERTRGELRDVVSYGARSTSWHRASQLTSTLASMAQKLTPKNFLLSGSGRSGGLPQSNIGACFLSCMRQSCSDVGGYGRARFSQPDVR